MYNDYNKVRNHLAHFGISGQKKGLRRFQSYQVAPTRSGMVGQEVGEAAAQRGRLAKKAKAIANRGAKEAIANAKALSALQSAPGAIISAHQRGRFNSKDAEYYGKARTDSAYKEIGELNALSASERFALSNAIRKASPNYFMPTPGTARIANAIKNDYERAMTIKDAVQGKKSYGQAKFDRQKAKVEKSLAEELARDKKNLQEARKELKLMKTNPEKWASTQDDEVDLDRMSEITDRQANYVKSLENKVKNGGDPRDRRAAYVKAGIYHKAVAKDRKNANALAKNEKYLENLKKDYYDDGLDKYEGNNKLTKMSKRAYEADIARTEKRIENLRKKKKNY